MCKNCFGVRIAVKDRWNWHGFTMRRGHLYMTVKNCDGTKDLIVTALEPGKNNTVKIYAAAYSWEKWRPYYIPADDPLIVKFKRAAPVLRESSGIDSVAHTTVADEIRDGRIPHIMQRNGKFNSNGGRVFC